MNDRRLISLLPMAFLAVACTSLGIAWVVDAHFAPTAWPARLGLVLGGAALVFATIRIAVTQSQKAAAAAQRYASRLCELDKLQLQDENALDIVPVREEDGSWRELCQKLRERMAELARQADEVEMARAGVEVRIRRITAERDQLR